MATTVDVAELIDSQKVSRYQCVIAFMAWLTLFLDGVDNQSIAYVAPALTNDWDLGRGALRTVFSAGVLGVAIGALVIGPLADRFGRKLVTVLTVVYVGAFSLLVTQVAEISQALTPVLPGASNLNVLMVLRFLTGLGLGAVVPLGVVIVNEIAPKRRRAAMVTLMGCGYAMGSASGGLLASNLVPTLGWPAQIYLNNWLPTMTTETGLPEAQALRAAASLQFGGMLGVISLGFLADRFGFFKVLAASFTAGGIFIALIGWAGAAFYPLSATIFVSGFFNIGTQITLAALAATLYPTDIRSTGVSWAHGVARIGSIISVMFAGTMLALHWPLETMYMLVSIPMFFGCVWILILANVRAKTSRGAAEPEGRRAMA